jgi:hypothetical protein
VCTVTYLIKHYNNSSESGFQSVMVLVRVESTR